MTYKISFLNKLLIVVFAFSVFGVVAFAQKPVTQKLLVADKMFDCNKGYPPKRSKCLLTKNSPEDKWSLFRSDIKGFKHIEGYTYELLIKATTRKNTSGNVSKAKPSSYKTEYSLVKILSKRRTNGKTANEFQGDDGSQNQVAIDSQKWMLVEIDGEAVKIKKAYIEFNLAEKQIGGDASCNRLMAGFEANGNNIKFTGVATTKMMCMKPGLMEIENQFVRKIEAVTRYEQTGQTLKFYAGDVLVLKFSGSDKVSTGEPTMNVELDNKKWVLATIGSKAVPALQTEPFLIFDQKSKGFSGNTGCNSVAGRYEIDGDKITFSAVRMTERACVETNQANAEKSLVNAFSTANRFKIEGDKLSFYNGSVLLISFKGKEK